MLPDLHELVDRDDWQTLADHFRAAFVAVTLTPNGRHRRRLFFTLAAAEHTVSRARDRGQPAEIWLAELKPVYRIPADPDLGGDQ